MKNRKGFTLIELLVVIVIIGILATYLVPSVMGAPARARDAARQATLNAIKTAMTAYYADYGKFPEGSVCFAGTDSTSSSGIDTEDLEAYFDGGNLPTDPQTALSIEDVDCNGFYYKSLKVRDNARANTAYIVAAIAEIKSNVNEDCSRVKSQIESLDDLSSDFESDDEDKWCMIVSGS